MAPACLLLAKSSPYCLITPQHVVVDLVKQNALITAIVQK